jgi:hypothetical protein
MKNLGEICADFEDLWAKLHPDEIGWTFDSTVNKMIHQVETMRYDRAILRSNGGWKASDIRIIGKEPFRVEDISKPTKEVPPVKRVGYDNLEAYPEIWISDHFGLLVDLVYQK